MCIIKFKFSLNSLPTLYFCVEYNFLILLSNIAFQKNLHQIVHQIKASMKNLKTLFLQLVLAFAFLSQAFGQSIVPGTTIANATFMCNLSNPPRNYTLLDSSSSLSAQPGPNYGCLNSFQQIRPHWFKFEVGALGGTFSVALQPTLNNNLEYAVYGPFNTPNPSSSHPLFSQNPLACSNSIILVDTIRLFNLAPGGFYFILVTNPEGRNGTFSFVPDSRNNVTFDNSLKFDDNLPSSVRICAAPFLLTTIPSTSSVNPITFTNITNGLGVNAQTGLFTPSVAGLGLHRIVVVGNPYECLSQKRDTISIQVVSDPSVVDVTASGNLIPGGGSVVVAAIANPGGNYNYSWTVPSAFGTAPSLSTASFPTNFPGWYKVVTTPNSVSLPACSGSSDSVYVYVGPQISRSRTDTICWNSNPGISGSLVSPLPTGVTASYQWKFSPDGGSTWLNIVGQNNPLTIPTLSVHGVLLIRLDATLTNGVTLQSNQIPLIVYAPLQRSTFSLESPSTSSTICFNGTINLRISPTLGGKSTKIYEWQRQQGSTWVEILPRSSALTRTFANLTTATRYRVIATDSAGCGSVISDTMLVTVQCEIQPGSICLSNPADTLVCINNPITINPCVPLQPCTGAQLFYYWQESTDGVNWATVATNSNGTFSLSRPYSGLGRMYYRRGVLSRLNNVNCPVDTAFSNFISVTWVKDYPHLSLNSTLNFSGQLSHSVWENFSSNATYQNTVTTNSLTYESIAIAPSANGFVEYRLPSGSIPSDGIIVFDFKPGQTNRLRYTASGATSGTSVPSPALVSLSRNFIVGTGAINISNIPKSYYIKVFKDQSVVLRIGYTGNSSTSTIVDGVTYNFVTNAATILRDTLSNFKFYPNKLGTTDIICPGGSASISNGVVSTSSTPSNWQWSKVTGFGTLTGNLSGTSGDVSTVTYNSVAADAGSVVHLRLVASRSDGPCNGRSDTVNAFITVRPTLIPANVVSGQARNRCYSTAAGLLTAVPASGGTGPYAYTWQSQVVGSGLWVNIPGANSLTYEDTRLLTASTEYRILTTDLGAPSCGSNVASANSFTVRVLASLSAPIFSDSRISIDTVCPNTGISLSVSPAFGGHNNFTYTWQEICLPEVPGGVSDPAMWPWRSISGKINQSAPAGLTYTTPNNKSSGTSCYYRVIATDVDTIPDPNCGSVWSRSILINTLDTVKPIIVAQDPILLYAGADGFGRYNCANVNQLNNGSSDNCGAPVLNYLLRAPGTGLGSFGPSGPACSFSSIDLSGITFATARPVTLPFNGILNNGPGQGYGNYFGQPSPEIYVRFNSGSFDSVRISTCGATWNTYLHLRDCGTLHIQNDNAICPSSTDTFSSVIVSAVQPNTDYVVVFEGSGSSTGSANLSISGISYCPGFSCKTSNNRGVLIGRDQSGNIGTDTFIVNVIDTVKPIARSKNITIYLNSNGTVTPNASLANNNSTDNCTDTLRFSIVPSFYTCANLGSTPAVLTVRDASNNTSTSSLSVTTLDTIRPISRPKSKVLVYLDSTGNGCLRNPIDSASTDNCSITSRTFSVPGRSDSCFNCTHLDSLFTGVYTVKDQSNNSSSTSFVIDVVDTVAPRVVSTPPGIVNLRPNEDCQELYYWQQNWSFVDNCQGPISIDSLSWRLNGSTILNWSQPVVLLPYGLHTISFTVRDARGNPRNYVHSINVRDTVRPRLINCPSNVSVTASANSCGALASWTPPSVLENCNSTLTLTPNMPSGSFFPVGTHNLKYLATDVAGNRDSCTFSILVQDVVRPQLIPLNPNVVLSCNSNGAVSLPVASMVNASDNCTSSGSLIYTINSVSRNSFPITCANLGVSQAVNVKACDASGNCDSVVVFVNVVDTCKPILNINNIVNLSLGSGSNASATLSLGQVDIGSTDNCGIVSRTLSKTVFNCNDLGSNQVQFCVTDASGNQRCSFVTVIVSDINSPNVNTIPQTVFIGAQGTVIVPTGSWVQVSDNCSVDSIIPASYTFNCSSVSPTAVNRSLVVRDGSGNVTNVSVPVLVRDTIKPLVFPITSTYYLNSSGSVTVQSSSLVNATDNCCLSSLVPASLSFSCSNVGGNTRTIRVNDCNGNFTDVNVQISILDTFAPLVTAIPTTVYLGANCSTCVNTSTLVTATDVCGIGGYLPSNVCFSSAQCSTTVNVNVTVRDVNNNLTTRSIPVLVLDTIKPSWLSFPINVTVGKCSSNVAFLTPTGTDNCGAVMVTQTGGLPSGANYPYGITTNTFVLSDACGNTLTRSFTVTVNPINLPAVPSLPLAAYCTSDSCVSFLPSNLNGYSFTGSGVIGNSFCPSQGTPDPRLPITWVYRNSTLNCDTTGTFFVDLIPAPLAPTITRISLTCLRSDVEWSAYQWYRGDQPIPGATSRDYCVTDWGLYSCRVMSAGGCFQVSNSIPMGIGVGEPNNALDMIRVFPNPSNGVFNLDLSGFGLNQSISVCVKDMLGKVVYQDIVSETTASLNLSHLSNGKYFLGMLCGSKQVVQSIQIVD